MSENNMDEIDISILRMLQRDARKSFKEIANESGVSVETIRNRFNNMKRKGIVRGTTIVIDSKKLSNMNTVIFGITITHPFSDQVINLAKTIPGMIVVTRAMGSYDIEAIAILDDIEQIGKTKDIIIDHQQVKNVEVDILIDKPLLCYQNFEFN
jgi:Lrp/AsnC family transcriptional regulator for asnA, asnC and gidA